MSRTEQSVGNLKSISEDLKYEIAMLNYTANYLPTLQRGTVEYNVYLESFCVHARNLVHFLFPSQSPCEKDVLAADFFKDKTLWEQNRPGLPNLLKGVRNRVSKTAVHLSYDRMKKSEKERIWCFGNIRDEINRILGVFNTTLKHESAHYPDLASEFSASSSQAQQKSPTQPSKIDRQSIPTLPTVAGMTGSVFSVSAVRFPDKEDSEDGS